MSLAAPLEGVYPDIITAFSAIQAYAKAHGYVLLSNLRYKENVRLLGRRYISYGKLARLG
jgi:hypothetical protein